jgi:hypothetical protein
MKVQTKENPEDYSYNKNLSLLFPNGYWEFRSNSGRFLKFPDLEKAKAAVNTQVSKLAGAMSYLDSEWFWKKYQK